MKVDTRLVAATNRDLQKMVNEGTFREDLYFRLNVVQITMPPLRDRTEDLPILLNHFLEEFAEENHIDAPTFEPGAMQCLRRYSWPGNIRELENVIERVMILCAGETIRVSDLPQGFKDNVYNTLHLEGIPANAKLYDTLAMIERTMIERALKMSNNVQSHAAELLGIGKSGLNQKIKKYNLEVGVKH